MMETPTGCPAGVVSGRVTMTGMLVRLPAPSATTSFEKETVTPGSSVIFSSITISWLSKYVSAPLPGFSNLIMTRVSSSTSTVCGCSVGEVTSMAAR